MGRTEDAAEVLEELYAERPDHRGVREVLADIYVCGGRADEAMALLIEAEALDPDNAGIHHLKGVIFSGRKLWRDAIVSLRRARTLQPGSLDVGRALSMALLNGGAPKEGRKMLEQLASAVPLSQQVQLDLAVAEAITGDTEKALNRIDHLESGEPGDQPTISRMVEVRRIIDKLAKQSNDGSGNGVDHQD
jgi:predicted Zn-dependent protease